MATPIVRKYIIDGEFEKLKGTVATAKRIAELRSAPTELFQKQIIDVNEAAEAREQCGCGSISHWRGITNATLIAV